MLVYEYFFFQTIQAIWGKTLFAAFPGPPRPELVRLHGLRQYNRPDGADGLPARPRRRLRPPPGRRRRARTHRGEEEGGANCVAIASIPEYIVSLMHNCTYSTI